MKPKPPTFPSEIFAWHGGQRSDDLLIETTVERASMDAMDGGEVPTIGVYQLVKTLEVDWKLTVREKKQ